MNVDFRCAWQRRWELNVEIEIGQEGEEARKSAARPVHAAREAINCAPRGLRGQGGAAEREAVDFRAAAEEREKQRAVEAAGLGAERRLRHEQEPSAQLGEKEYSHIGIMSRRLSVAEGEAEFRA